MPFLLAESSRTAAQATIRRATFAAHQAVESLDTAALTDLERIYRAAAEDIAASIRAYAGADGNLMLQEMRSVLAQIEGRLRALSQARDALLEGNLIAAADLGVRPFTAAGLGDAAAAAVLDSGAAMRVSHSAVEFVRNFIAEDGLQLSDRLWRMDRATRDAVVNSIEQAVIQGHSADQAARELLRQGVGVPDDVMAKVRAADASGINQAVRDRMLGQADGGSALYNARRLMRTEINRAHGEAYMGGGEQHPDFAGWRMLLSPAHPRADICDLLTAQNLHGLGPGVYPDRARTPWPPHPNFLTFVVIVFKNEITDADRGGKETSMAALGRLSEKQQEGVLGVGKAALYDAGKLTRGMIRAPLRAVKSRLQRQKKLADTDGVVIPLRRVALGAIGYQQIVEAGGSVIRLAYDPRQPRSPKGTSVGGRWIGQGTISAFAERAAGATNIHEKYSLGRVTNAGTIRQATGLVVTGYHHRLDNFGIRHALNVHGDPLKEARRGQKAVTMADILRVPEALRAPDRIAYGGRTRIGRDTIRFEKRFGDETLVYIAEVRSKRRELATQTLYVLAQK